MSKGVPDFQRRALCRLMAFLPLMTLAGPALGVIQPWIGVPSVSALAGLVSDRRGVRRIGFAYLRDHPLEADTDRLVSGLFPDPWACRLVKQNHSRPDELRRYLKRRIREDFEAGATVNLEGWILSRTECRVCALVAYSG